MEPDKLFSDSPNQTALQEAELAALLRMLSISEGTFSLSIAICNSPSLREYLIGKVTEQKAGIEKIQIEKNCTDLLASAEKKLTSKTPSAIFITEIENALPSDEVQPRIIRNLNASRELWQQKFSCPVVFWLAEYAATILQKNALDFASWISHIFEFVSEQATAVAGTLDAYAGDIMSASRLDADPKRLRIAELEQRIEEAGVPPRAQLAQHVLIWLHELAYIYSAIGDLDAAEENILELLRMAEKFGLQAAMATAYGNLGVVYRTRGDLDKAEQMHNKALEIDEKLERLEGMAGDYGNLGILYRLRGDLDKALQMHLKSLEISKKLGRSEAVMQQYGNLGIIYDVSGDIDRAEEMYKKVIDIADKLELREALATAYNNLGSVYLKRGDLDMAERMVLKALGISDAGGIVGLEASQYANLGLIFRTRGDSDKARAYWEKAAERFKKIGMKLEAEKTERLIDELKDK
jgi:tetratricopeptide (TPR) repeat protein